MHKDLNEIMDFFTKSNHIWVSENFQNIILNKYDGLENRDVISVGSSNINDIETELITENMLFKDTNTFVYKLVELLQKQINGEPGILLNDSSANYFYIKSGDEIYSVLIRWEPSQKMWRCGAYLQEGKNMPNIKMFYPNSNLL